MQNGHQTVIKLALYRGALDHLDRDAGRPDWTEKRLQIQLTDTKIQIQNSCRYSDTPT